jgi:type III restriction enzyme
MMKIKFIRDQEYQLEAISSIVDIFRGQAIKAANFTVSLDDQVKMHETDLGIGNLLELTDEELLSSVKDIQMRNGLPKSTDINNHNFTIEMETGTGKTYVYTRTIYELNKNYGFTKFIIVVPSVAIREGVYKSLQITKEHFGEIYQNQPCNYFIYDSSKLDQIRSFATSSDIEIMIINIDAFRKGLNIINRNNDRMNGRRPIELVAETNPVVIIDEPQSVDNTEKAKEAIASLNPLCILRYSATHRQRYNLMYRLDPVDAYEKKLVK